MLIYIVGFAVSLFLIYYAESKRFNNREAKMCVIVALFIPCLIAGLRAESVGTDVEVYVQPLFENALAADSFLDYLSSGYYYYSWQYSLVADIEIGFNIMCYLIAKVFNSLSVLLFVIQVLIVVPIYKGLRAFPKTQPVWLGMAVFYLMFYNQTLNMMRQWIAMALLFYAFQFLIQGKNRNYFLVMIAAMLFHVSAILGLAIFAVYHLVGKDNSYNKAWKTFLLVVIGIVSIFSLDFFVLILKFFGLRYGNYISGSLELMPRQLLYRIPLILLMLWRWKYLKRADKLSNFYWVMIFYDLLASQLTSIFAHSGRIGVYCSEFYILTYPALCVSSNNKKNRQVMRLFVLCYLSFYWWYTYAYGGSGETIPYVSVWG